MAGDADPHLHGNLQSSTSWRADGTLVALTDRETQQPAEPPSAFISESHVIENAADVDRAIAVLGGGDTGSRSGARI
jgi:hypothetical protein